MLALSMAIGLLLASPDDPLPASEQAIRLSRSAEGELDVRELVTRLSEAADLRVLPKPGVELRLPLDGLAGALSRKVLTDALGPDVRLSVETGQVVVFVPPDLLSPARRAELSTRLSQLSDRVEAAARRASSYGMRARPSFRPNDTSHPTVCLIHGLNSTSGSFEYLSPALERRGFGVVVYDYAFNRRLAESATEFQADWVAFRTAHGERQPWSIITHSMGALLARDYVEGTRYGGDISALLLIAPPNQGAALARNQTILQFVQGIRAANAGALARLSEGLGASAEDLSPGSPYLRELNARPRRAGVAYHILAGDVGFVSRETRRQVESQMGIVASRGGFLGGLARLATGSLQTQLDEASDGTGDGCVAVASTQLEGVADRVVIPANHVELIRGPLLYPDPGPIVCLPYVLRWLGHPDDGQNP